MASVSARKVLFISADQWRGECLSYLGHPLVKTPHLDALAREGVAFRRHYTVVAPCGPARASLHTGLYLMNHRSGRNGTPLDARHPNLAKSARKAGYDPHLFGYTDTSPDPRERDAHDPALRSFEGVLPGYSVGLQLPDHMAPWLAHLKAKNYPIESRQDIYRPRPGFAKPADRGHRFVPTIFAAEDSETAFMADAILKWLSVRRHENWFLHGVFLRPHPPVICPEPYNALYDPAAIPLPHRRASPEAEAKQHPLLAHWIAALERGRSYDEHNPNNLVRMPDLEWRQMRACYFGMISQVDDAIGRLIAHLKASGEYDETLIVFTCDHGEMGGDHYVWGKELYFDQSFHIPLIIRDPRREADRSRGAVIDRFTESVDLMPTLLDWLGVEAPANGDGRSLLPLLEGVMPADWREGAMMELDFRNSPNTAGIDMEGAYGLLPDECQLAIWREARWKYVHCAKLPPLLFDLDSDPWEMNDLAGDPAYRDIRLAMAEKLLGKRMIHAERTLSNLHLGPEGVENRQRRR